MSSDALRFAITASSSWVRELALSRQGQPGYIHSRLTVRLGELYQRLSLFWTFLRKLVVEVEEQDQGWVAMPDRSAWRHIRFRVPHWLRDVYIPESPLKGWLKTAQFVCFSCGHPDARPTVDSRSYGKPECPARFPDRDPGVKLSEVDVDRAEGTDTEERHMVLN